MADFELNQALLQELPYRHGHRSSAHQDLPLQPTISDPALSGSENKGATLLNLPPELQAAIFSWLFRPADLARVCLVSKQLFDVVTPQLYHSLYLNVDRWSREHLESVLTRGHRGHAYIRNLDIDSVELKSERRALKVAKDALQMIPRGQLQAFRCPLETGIDNDLLILLAANQRNLSFIGLGPILPEAFYSLMECLLPWPPNISTIVIPWKLFNDEDVQFYQRLIERSHHRLKALTVRAHDFPPLRWDYSQDPPALSDVDGDTEMLACSLLHHLSYYSIYPRTLQLHDLNLQNQDLAGVTETWLMYVDFTKLQTMQIWNCDNADVLLEALEKMAQHQRLRLHGLVLSFEEAEQAPQRAQQYLAATSGLSYLNLCYVPTFSANQSFSVRSIAPHASTIRDLFIGIGSNITRNTPLSLPRLSDIEWLASNCTKLRQLAIPLPPLNTDDALAGRWGEYEEILALLATLPHLKVFRILTWPYIAGRPLPPRDNCGAQDAFKVRYLHELRIIASSIARLFTRLRGDHGRRLSVITFGHAEYPHYIYHGNGERIQSFGTPLTFKITRVMSEFGFRTKVRQIPADQMEYEEPIAYVVDEDTDQGLSLEAYSWGSRPSESP
ncbi:uncharacterized protein LTR77_002709 [Saxophila tyrrhenica]|uniref:F-box domain-containing protein n=1 Tax=Saxophila tyrrhenica TaxID=1690608 RepID=A0AAV9PFE4_9PEZI|nr:hypothetical protein LTR77_002709 [Saxophila tyrrhenica]